MPTLKKVLMITNKIPHYRLDLYNLVGNRYRLTIAHTGVSVNSTHFNEIKLRENKRGPFLYYKGVLKPNDFDVVIVYLNIRLLNLYKILFTIGRNYKTILFGIGVSASYNKRYDRDKRVGYVTKYLINKSDAAIFYDNYPTIKYSSMGVSPQKMFVAYNTIASNNQLITPVSERNSILFIGSLYKQKSLEQLLAAYKKGLHEYVQLPILNIIGDGPHKDYIESWILKHNFGEKIKVLGEITEESLLKPYFDHALCCVSPGQAGLSVQKAFSYGVPFITSYYPISGGEFTSIIDGVTGFFYDGTINGLLEKLIEVVEHINLDMINENCKVYHNRFRSPKVWTDGFCRAIEYAINN